MRLAYLILAHKNPEQLKRLASKLSNANSTIFIHLDKKSDENQFNNIAGMDNVFLIKNRTTINWGGFSMIEATVNGLKEIMGYYPGFDHINLLSGMDYPIKSNNEIERYLYAYNNTEFIYNLKSPSYELPQGGCDRYEYYYNYDSNMDWKNDYEIEMKARGIKREFISGMQPYHGSQWWTLTSRCISYILATLENNKDIFNFYRYTKFPDEQLFQTIVMNSSFSNNVINENLRYIDWSSTDWRNVDWDSKIPHPRILTLQDYNKLKKSNKLFARKLDVNIDKRLLDYIDQTLIRKY